MSSARPLLRWHGGKWRLAPWIISQMPEHRVYVEPYGGAASVLLRKPRAYAEVYNDLDGDVVNLFRVLRSDDASELIRRIRLTPFARDEFLQAYEPASDDIDRARSLIARSFMGFGSTGATMKKTGFRGDTIRSGTAPSHDWAGYPDSLKMLVDRIAGVVIENMPAGEIFAKYDRPETLFYVDPPYVHATRTGDKRKVYRHEMDDDDHRAMLSTVIDLRGRVMLSGYDCAIYKDALAGWHRIEKATHGDGASDRTETLWMNFEPPQRDFFSAEEAMA